MGIMLISVDRMSYNAYKCRYSGVIMLISVDKVAIMLISVDVF